MNWWKKAAVALPLLLLAVAGGLFWFFSTYDDREPSRLAFAERCARCHGEVLELEKLLDSLGRIRDVEMGADGLVDILIEHAAGGSLVRLVPR